VKRKGDCPQCGAENEILTTKNLLDEEVTIIRCVRCKSLSVSHDDEVHWFTPIQSKEGNEEDAK